MHFRRLQAKIRAQLLVHPTVLQRGLHEVLPRAGPRDRLGNVQDCSGGSCSCRWRARAIHPLSTARTAEDTTFATPRKRHVAVARGTYVGDYKHPVAEI
jgi:hypothetical protein